jgi:uncharacterized protein YciI
VGLFFILCHIDETKLDLFAALRAEHYDFLIAHHHRLRFGGPARASADGPPELMIMIAEAASQAAAEAWIAQEPYNAHGGFRSIVVRPWSQVIPEVEPGALEETRARERAKRGAA